MSNEQHNPKDVCIHHSGIVVGLCAARKMKQDMAEMWIDIKSKVSMRLFLVSVVLMVGFFGTIGTMQMKILERTAVIGESVKNIEKNFERRISQIETDIKFLQKQ